MVLDQAEEMLELLRLWRAGKVTESEFSERFQEIHQGMSFVVCGHEPWEPTRWSARKRRKEWLRLHAERDRQLCPVEVRKYWKRMTDRLVNSIEEVDEELRNAPRLDSEEASRMYWDEFGSSSSSGNTSSD